MCASKAYFHSPTQLERSRRPASPCPWASRQLVAPRGGAAARRLHLRQDPSCGTSFSSWCSLLEHLRAANPTAAFKRPQPVRRQIARRVERVVRHGIVVRRAARRILRCGRRRRIQLNVPRATSLVGRVAAGCRVATRRISHRSGRGRGERSGCHLHGARGAPSQLLRLHSSRRAKSAKEETAIPIYTVMRPTPRSAASSPAILRPVASSSAASRTTSTGNDAIKVAIRVRPYLRVDEHRRNDARCAWRARTPTCSTRARSRCAVGSPSTTVRATRRRRAPRRPGGGLRHAGGALLSSAVDGYNVTMFGMVSGRRAVAAVVGIGME